jgi:hypothetical protein
MLPVEPASNRSRPALEEAINADQDPLHAVDPKGASALVAR